MFIPRPRRIMSEKMAISLVGKRVSADCWIIHDDYDICEITGRLHHINDLLISFPHCRFTNEELKHIKTWCEDAAYLSEGGYAQCYDAVVDAGLGDEFYGRVGMQHCELIEDQRRVAIEKGWQFDG